MKGLIFTYLLTYGGAAASLFTPWVGLLVYVAFAILRPESLWFWSVPPGNYSRIVAVALLAGWALRGFGDWKLGAARAPLVALIGFFAWSCCAAMFAPEQQLAWRYVEDMFKIVLPVVAGITLIGSVSQLRQLAWVIALSEGYVALDLNLSYFSGFNRLRQQGFGSIDNNSVAIGMVAGVGLAFFLGLGERVWWRKIPAFACAAFMTHAAMFAYSRGAMLSLIITGGLAFLLIPKQPKHYLAFAIAVLLAWRMAGPSVIERFSTTFADAETRDASADSRLVMWKACLNEIADHPLLGLGPNQFPLIVERYGFETGKEAHTLWLQTGAELGIPGLICLLGYYGLCVKRLWTVRNASWKDPWLNDAARMVIAAITGFGVAAQFVSVEALELPYYVGMLGLGALKLTSVQTSDSKIGVLEGTGYVKAENAFFSPADGNSRSQPELL